MDNTQPKYKFICTDFDGTICANGWPRADIGTPIESVIAFLKHHHDLGTKIILYTSRCNYFAEGEMYLDDAINWCVAHEVPIDAINENPWDELALKHPGYRSAKPFADLYIDDRSINPALLNQIDEVQQYWWDSLK